MFRFVQIYTYIYDIMDRHGHNNIRNGILWVQTGHSSGTCTVTLSVIEPRTHQKIESFKKIKDYFGRHGKCAPKPLLRAFTWRLRNKPLRTRVPSTLKTSLSVMNEKKLLCVETRQTLCQPCRELALWRKTPRGAALVLAAPT